MPRYTFHDARTGEFVTAGHAADNPDTTVRIEQHPNLHLATPMQLLQELSRRAAKESMRQKTWLTTPPEAKP